MIVIFYAFGREMSALRRRFEDRAPIDARGVSGFRGRLAGVEAAAIATGIGPMRARAKSRRAFEEFAGAELAISTGVAGALSPGLEVGDVVVADGLVTETGRPGEAACQCVVATPERLAKIQDALRAAAMRFSTGALLTSSHPLITADQKRRAKAESGAIAVDMESAAIAAEARRQGVPLVCVRSILDTAGEDVMGADLVDENGSVRRLRTAGFLLRHPVAIVMLSRIARNLGIASKSLADAIEAVTRRIGVRAD